MNVGQPFQSASAGHGLNSADTIMVQPALLSFALHLTGSRADAEDLVQDTLLRGHRRFDRWEPGTNLRAWLSTLMLNIFRSQWAAKRRRAERTGQDEPPSQAVEPSQDAALALSRIDATLPNLASHHRAVLQMALDGATYEEMATSLHVPIGTIRSRLFRARHVLRSEAHVG